MVTLGKRQKDIIHYLLKIKENSTIKEIALIFNVSERTIRYDLDIIEAWLKEKNVDLIRKPRLGVGIDLGNKNAHEILNELTSLENIDYSAEERQFHIKLLLFLSANYITLEDISEIIKVSKNTIISDLDKIEEEFYGSEISLDRKTYYGIKFLGKESSIRNETSKLIGKGLKKGLLSSYEIEYLFEDIDKALILKAIKEKENLLEISYTEESIKELIVNIAVAIKRVKKGKSIECVYDLDKDNRGYATTKKALEIIEKADDIVFDENEINYLDKIFKGAKIRDSINFPGEYENENVNIIVQEIVEDVKKYLGIDLEKDVEIINGLRTHLEVAFYRISNNLTIENPLTDQIKYRYPFIFEMSRKILNKHKTFLGGKLIDDEIAYVAMHIGAAFERNKSSSFMPNVLLVCGSGFATSNLLKTRLNIMLLELKYMGPVSVHEVDECIKKNNVDFVISTSPLEISGIEVIRINPLLDNEDLSRLKTLIFKNTVRKQLDYISDINGANAYRKVNYLGELLNSEEVNLKVDCENWREAIHLASKPLIEQKSITKDYIDAMIKAVEELGPYMVFIPQVALTHASNHNGVLKDSMSLLTLKENIKFGDKGNEEVRIIIVLASLNPELYMEKLVKLVEILEQEAAVDILINADSYEEIMYLRN